MTEACNSHVIYSAPPLRQRDDISRNEGEMTPLMFEMAEELQMLTPSPSDRIGWALRLLPWKRCRLCGAVREGHPG